MRYVNIDDYNVYALYGSRFLMLLQNLLSNLVTVGKVAHGEHGGRKH